VGLLCIRPPHSSSRANAVTSWGSQYVIAMEWWGAMSADSSARAPV
jgi:hypothetical protein